MNKVVHFKLNINRKYRIKSRINSRQDENTSQQNLSNFEKRSKFKKAPGTTFNRKEERFMANTQAFEGFKFRQGKNFQRSYLTFTDYVKIETGVVNPLPEFENSEKIVDFFQEKPGTFMLDRLSKFSKHLTSLRNLYIPTKK